MFLKGNKRAKLLLHPSAGVITAQDPSKELVIVMFKLANILNVRVYSDRLKRYESVDDWEKRTKKYHQTRDKNHAEFKKNRQLYRITWVIFISSIILTTWLITPSNIAYWLIIPSIIFITVIITWLLDRSLFRIK